MTTENVPVEHLPYAKKLVTSLPYAESKLRTTIGEAVGAASTCWENLAGAGIFESDRAVKIADELTDQVLALSGMGQPCLGCATTRELLEELSTRIELGHGGLDYRTVDG